MTMLPISADELVPISTADFRALRQRLFMPPIAAARIKAAARVTDARQFRRAFISDVAARKAAAQRHAAWLVSLFRSIDCSSVIDLRGKLRGPEKDEPDTPTAARIAAIIYMIARKHGHEPETLMRGGHRYMRPVAVIARHECFYELAREFPDARLKDIGRMLGGFDHATVINGIARHEKRNGLRPLRAVTRRPRT